MKLMKWIAVGLCVVMIVAAAWAAGKTLYDYGWCEGFKECDESWMEFMEELEDTAEKQGEKKTVYIEPIVVRMDEAEDALYEQEKRPEEACEAKESEDEEASYVPAEAQEPKLVLLDTFIATAYCDSGTTATGTTTTEGRTLAVNPEDIPYGTHVWLYLDDGTFVGDYYAEDTGGNLLRQHYIVDIYNPSYEWCVNWGAQHVSVFVEK